MSWTSKTSVRAAAVLFSAALLGAPATARAQQAQQEGQDARGERGHVVAPGQLDRAAATHESEAQARRDEVLEALERRQVKDAAERLDVDLVEARDAVRTMDGAALAQVAEKARRVNRALSGGAATITLSTTALVIALLILLILVVD